MEVNGYIGRVLSSSDPNLVDPDLLRDASSIAEMGDLPGLDLDTLNEWRGFANRDPNPDEFLYRRLLLAQCKALAEGIPALFDPRQNYQALFLPGNLLNQDSIVRRLVKEILEDDWQDIEVVGWLYQFYISERKDEVIGAKSKVAAADIPAATQLFTPHWIVQYMVENSLGRLWLESHPKSRLREYMPYYLENPEPLPNPLLRGEGTREENSCSPPRVGEGLGERCFDFPSTGSEHRAQHKSLTPQELTVIDPACGSGHILVYAFDLLFEIYKEQGYLERDIPALILTHNLYGLDIDERAAQLASFAVLMKARSHNSRILRKPPALNITAVRPTHSQTLPPATELNAEDWQPLIEAFKDAENLGSLITPPTFDAQKLQGQLDNLEASSSLFREYVPALRGLILQAEWLRNKYFVVVANPPYMRNKSLNQVLKDFASKNYPDSKSDAFSMFMERFDNITHDHSYLGLLTPFVWMFLSTYEEFRIKLLNNFTITSLVQLEYNAFEPDCIPVCTFSLQKPANKNKLGAYIKLSDFKGHQNQAPKTLKAIQNRNCGYLYYAKSADFVRIPSSPIAYWATCTILKLFDDSFLLKDISVGKKGIDTSKNDRFLRFWFEISRNNLKSSCLICQEAKISNKKWFPLNKGGSYKKWYGNQEWVINWANDGLELFSFPKAYIRNLDFYFQPSISWTGISSSSFVARFYPEGFIFDSTGPSLFFESDKASFIVIAIINSKLSKLILADFAPTLHFEIGQVLNIPIPKQWINNYENIFYFVYDAISISRQDWDNLSGAEKS